MPRTEDAAAESDRSQCVAIKAVIDYSNTHTNTNLNVTD